MNAGLNITSRGVLPLRLHITNTWTPEEKDPNNGQVISEATWSLKIYGKLADASVAGLLPMAVRERRFTDHIKSIFIQLDKDMYPESNTVEWINPAHQISSNPSLPITGTATGPAPTAQGASSSTSPPVSASSSSTPATTPAATQSTSAQPGATASAAAAASGVSKIKDKYIGVALTGWAGRESASDGFTVKRAGATNTVARIFIAFAHDPPRYRVVPLLAKLLGLTGNETRNRVLLAFWDYVKRESLVEENVIRCDGALQAVFGVDRLPIETILESLDGNLVPEDSAEFVYNVVCDTLPPSAHEVIYDVELEVPGPTWTDLASQITASDPAVAQQEASADNALRVATVALNEARRRHAVLSGFAEEPVRFLQEAFVSEAHDMQRAARNVTTDPLAFERSALYYRDDVIAGSAIVLNKQTKVNYLEKVKKKKDEVNAWLAAHPVPKVRGRR